MNILKQKELRIGVAGIIALLILIYGLSYLKGMSIFQPSSYFYVRFQNIQGLAKSSPVYADGYRVGTVRELHYDYQNAGNVIAEISVSPDLRIPKGSTAELSADLLGNVKMTLLLANNPREKYQKGDTIPSSKSNGFMDKASAMVPQIEQMVPKLDSILTSLNTILGDPALIETLHNVRNVSSNLVSTSKQLDNLVGNDVPQLVTKLNTIGDNVADLTGKLNQVDYISLMARVDSTLDNVKFVTEQLGRKDNTVGLLLNDASLYDNLVKTSDYASSLLEDLKSHPKRYVHFSIFGKKEKQN